MSKLIVVALLLVIVLIAALGFVSNRSAQAMTIKMHVRDLPEHGLTIISPSDPSFDGKLSALLKGEGNDVADNLKPFSIFIENKSKRTVVAYLIQWCFTAADGRNDCYRKAFSNPRALMGGENLSEGMERQSGRIKPNSNRFFSLVALDGRGAFRVPMSREELEEFKQGKFDGKALLLRFSAELEKYTDLTVSIDGAFFDDGTFVGPDTAGFFAQTSAMIDANNDLLNEITLEMSRPNVSRDKVFKQIEKKAKQPEINLDSKSTPADYYNYYKKAYADEVLRMRQALGDDKSLEAALRPLKKPWPMLHKKKF